MLTVIADENIAQLDAYFAPHTSVRLIKMAGRDIINALHTHQPDALLIRSVTPINEQALARTTTVRFIGSATLGIDHVDTHYLHQRGISFANAIGSSKHSVAQYVITAIAHLRPFVWHTPICLGIIGLGHIGSTLARYAKELGWQVLGYDPFLPSSTLNNASLSTLLSQSDVVSLHTPLSTTGAHPTYQLINAERLDLLRPDTLLINAARGQVVDETALLANIARTKRQVVLDTFFYEPSVSGALLNALALATPHIAGYTLDGKLRGTDMIYQSFCAQFELKVMHTLSDFLPNNPHHWHHLKTHPHLLPTFYNIASDDQCLRATAQPDVTPKQFDALRKTYPLKREWIFAP